MKYNLNRSQPATLSELREMFNNWKLNMYKSLLIYVIFFFTSKSLIDLIKKKHWLAINDYTALVIFVILGLLFIADSKITSYLKTPLQRLSINIEYSVLSKSDKSSLLQDTQEANELFKETFKKFGILAIPVMLLSLIDNGTWYVYSPDSFNELGKLKSLNETKIIGIVNKKTGGYLKGWMINICYVIPILYASYIILNVVNKLNKLNRIEKTKLNK